MSLHVVPAGAIPVSTAGVTTPASIDSSYSLTLPTGLQMPSGAGGPLCATICIERGDSTATGTRFTSNGTTPTASVGHLRPQVTSTAPDFFVVRGKEYLAALKFIGVSSGNKITYQFYIEDDRG